MNNKCRNAVISEMKSLLDSQGFVYENDYYKNETKAVKIDYDEVAKLYILSIANVVDGNIGEFSTASTWLFDENQTENDAKAVGVDFADTLRTAMGIKASRVSSNVALPTTEKGESINVLTLTQKLLAIFPQYKDDYKQEVADYGKFLYVDFLTSKFVPEIKDLISSKNKKQLKKLFDMLDEMYINGDSVTSDMVVILISSAVFGDSERIETAASFMEESKHMRTCVNEMLKELKSNKKLQIAVIK